MIRNDGRAYDELRPLKITPNYTKFAEGSVLIEQGDTKVICTASFEAGVPRHLVGSGTGWVTAEYNMLPRANRSRSPRDISKLKLSGRSAEIQRLIGRSLRSVINLSELGENTITIDCDVIQADGGTRCASITGGYVALALACKRLYAQGRLGSNPIKDTIAALSTGIVDVDGEEMICVDINYFEDSSAEVDFNVVMTGAGMFTELQGTGEGRPYTQEELNRMLDLTVPKLREVMKVQKQVIEETV